MANKSRIDTHIYNAIKYQMDLDLQITFVTQMLNVCKNNKTFQKGIFICQLAPFIATKNFVTANNALLGDTFIISQAFVSTYYLLCNIPHT